MTSWSIPLREVLWETNTVAPALFTCFCRERNPACPGVLVFLSVLPSQACDRGCGCVVMSGLGVGSPSHLPSWDQLPLEEDSVSFLQSRAQEAPPSRQALVARASTSRPWATYSRATSTHSLCRNQVNGMSLSPCPQRAGQGLPASLAPSALHDQMIVGLCRLLRPSATSPPASWQGMGPFL